MTWPGASEFLSPLFSIPRPLFLLASQKSQKSHKMTVKAGPAGLIWFSICSLLLRQLQNTDRGCQRQWKPVSVHGEGWTPPPPASASSSLFPMARKDGRARQNTVCFPRKRRDFPGEICSAVGQGSTQAVTSPQLLWE